MASSILDYLERTKLRRGSLIAQGRDIYNRIASEQLKAKKEALHFSDAPGKKSMRGKKRLMTSSNTLQTRVSRWIPVRHTLQQALGHLVSKKLRCYLDFSEFRNLVPLNKLAFKLPAAAKIKRLSS